jgi:uncharacterized cupredoxin-like copper-binding protein
MPTTTRTRRLKAMAAVCAIGLVAVACGDDDDTTTDASATTVAEGEPAAGEYEEYCTAIAEMEEADEFDPAHYERIKETAPDEISEEIDYVADAFIEAEGDVGKVFADPQVEEMLGPIEEFESESCPGEDMDAGDEAAIPAEAQEYCGLAAELDEQADFPTPEQLQALEAAAPEEIAEQVGVVVAAFIAADGDIGAAFSDPTVEENLGAIEEYETDVCGIGSDEGDGEDEEEVATEPLEGAQVIEVSAVDFGFDGIPATVPAGPTSFRLTNEGEAAHEMFMVRLADGVDLDELLASEEEPSPEEAEEIGGTFAPPGESAYLNVEELEPGTYAVVCFIPGPEGKSHHELGMKTTFTVS